MNSDQVVLRAVKALLKIQMESSENNPIPRAFSPGGVLPYLGYTGTCHWIGYGFLASLS